MMKNRYRFSKYDYILAAVLLIGCAVRILFIGQCPAGLNQDEASNGYEAFAVMNWGIDRNGVENPMHLIAWGSGQNMAYSWLAMPFLKIMGNSVLALRLPMAIMGCISVLVFFMLINQLCDKKQAVWATVYFAVFPWHIMKSRWALDCNIFPELVLWGCLCLVYYMNRQKPIYLYLAVVILAFSLYSYGTAYMFMPFFVGGVWIYMAVRKKITPKHFAISALVFFVLALPVILFVLINITDLPQLKILGFTIPKMYQQRFSTVTGTGENFFTGCLSNLKDLWNILVNQGDGLPWNSMAKYGICYRLFIPLIPAGIAVSIFERQQHSFVMHWWFVCALMVVAVTDVNVNRVNIVFIPLGYYIAVAIAFIAKQHKLLSCVTLAVCLCMFVLFGKTYFTDYNQNIGYYFYHSFDDALQLAESCDTERIYIGPDINQLYTLTLFYSEINPHTYIDTVEKANPYAAFETVTSFDRYHFYLPDNIDISENAAYIVPSWYAHLFSTDDFRITQLEHYTVAVPHN